VETIAVRTVPFMKIKKKRRMRQVRDVTNGGVLIATASASASSGPCVISVWQWRSKENEDEDWEGVAGGGWTLYEVVGFLVKLVVVFAAVAYVAGLVKQAVCKLYIQSCSKLIFAKTGSWTNLEPHGLVVEEQTTVVTQDLIEHPQWGKRQKL
jgi:hypothetical protein